MKRFDGKTGKPKIYLAGPDVFLPYPEVTAQAKKEILKGYGLEGLFPFDNEIKDPSAYPSREAMAGEIARLNFAMMDRCDACISHLTPFNGPSADVGTVGELHYMYAKGKPVFGYSNDTRSFFELVRDEVYRGHVFAEPGEDGNPKRFRASNGYTLENYGLPDNLMITRAINDSGGGFYAHAAPKAQYYSDLTAFEQAAGAAAAYFRRNTEELAS